MFNELDKMWINIVCVVLLTLLINIIRDRLRVGRCRSIEIGMIAIA